MVLALLAAFCPSGWLVAAIVAILGVAVLGARAEWRRVGAVALALALPVILLLPWSGQFFAHPSRLLTEAGRLDARTTSLGGDAWQLAFGRLQAPGDAPWWLTAGFVLAALFAWARADTRDKVAGAWVVLAAGLVVAGVASQIKVTDQGSGVEAYAWVGFAVVVAQAAAIVAAAIAADGLRQNIISGAFGWRQPVSLVVSIVAAVTPVFGLIWWVGAAPHGDLHRANNQTLPAYLYDRLREDSQPRILVIRGDAAEVDYQVLADDGYRLGDDSVSPRLGSAELDAVVADALSSSPETAVPTMADLGIGYVMMPSPADSALVAALDGLPGLTRTTNTRQVVGWQLDVPVGFARVLDSPDDAGAAEVFGTDAGAGSTKLGSGSVEREARIAVPPGNDFQVRYDGQMVRAAPDGTASTYPIGPGAGDLKVSPGGHRAWWLTLEALAWLVALVLATPSIARRQGLAEVEEVEE